MRQRQYISSVPAAMVYTELGDINSAFERLESAFHARDFELYSLQTEPVFDRLRPDVRYQDLLRRMNVA